MTAVFQHPGYEEERLRRAAERLPCREAQAGMLLSLMGEVGEPTSVLTSCPQWCKLLIYNHTLLL